MASESSSGREWVEEMRAATGYYHPGWRQREFTDWQDEQLAWKETCTIGDWSFISDLEVRGPDAEAVIAGLAVNTFAEFEVGRGKHLILCHESGNVIHEGVIRKLGEERFVIHSTPQYLVEYHLDTGGWDATAERLDMFKFQVQGPTSLAVLEDVAEGALRDISFIHFDDVTIRDVDVTAFRMGMAGELGFELQGPSEHADAVWDAIVEAGQAHGLRRLGGRTAPVNHLEACFPPRGAAYVPALFADDLADYRDWLRERLGGVSRNILRYPIEGSFEADDISAWYRTPVELGWENRIVFDHEFVGREALEAEVENPQRTIASLVWDPDDVVEVYASLFREGKPYKFMDMPIEQQWSMVADRVHDDGTDVGVSCMRGYSYYFRKMLSLTTIDVEYADPGTEVTVVWGDPDEPQKEIAATVASAPYKQDRRRDDISDV